MKRFFELTERQNGLNPDEAPLAVRAIATPMAMRGVYFNAHEIPIPEPPNDED